MAAGADIGDEVVSAGADLGAAGVEVVEAGAGTGAAALSLSAYPSYGIA